MAHPAAQEREGRVDPGVRADDTRDSEADRLDPAEVVAREVEIEQLLGYLELRDRCSARPPAVAWIVILGVAAVFVVGLVVLWAVPSWLTRHPSAGLSAAERLKAVNDARGSVITFLVVVGTAGTLIFTARTFQLNRAGQVAERYTRAVDQIGAETLRNESAASTGSRASALTPLRPDAQSFTYWAPSSAADRRVAAGPRKSRPRTSMPHCGSSAGWRPRPMWW